MARVLALGHNVERELVRTACCAQQGRKASEPLFHAADCSMAVTWAGWPQAL